MANELFSVKDYETILKNYYKTNEVLYKSAEFLLLSEDVEGFMGEHHKLQIVSEINGKEKSQTFFVKTKPLNNQVQCEILDETNMFDKEIFVLDFMLKEFEKYGFDTSFAPKCYYSIPGQTLILEDLSSVGYQMLPRNGAFDENEIKCLLKALALLHATGFAYERRKMKELGRSFNLAQEFPNELHEILFSVYVNKETTCYRWWQSALTTINRLIDLLPNNETYKTELKKMIAEFKIGRIFYEKSNKFAKTFGHGDLWSNNMLFRVQENIAEKCCLVDFQICRYFYPSFDVFLAIYLNTNVDFRQKHLNNLYSFYYSVLSETVEKYGYDIEQILPLQDFYDSLELIKVDALLQVAAVIPILYLPKDILNNSVNEEESLKEIMFDNNKNADIAYEKSDVFRNIVNYTMYDLYNALKIVKN